MGGKTKHLCQWSKAKLEKDGAKLREIVSAPRFVCTNCGRAAAKAKYLCKPRSLDA